MLDLLASFAFPLSIAATFVVTLVFSTKIKDFFSGIPADLRKDLNSIESATLSKVAAAQKAVVASVVPPPAPVAK